MRTTLQWNDTGDLGDYLAGLDELAAGSQVETNIWRSYIACNTYVVSEYFSTENNGISSTEILQINNPPTAQVHNRLNYYPYRRAFIQTVDGQSVEINPKRYIDNKLPPVISVTVRHATTPQPTSTLTPVYHTSSMTDTLVFSAYPTMDFVGKNITPLTQLTALDAGRAQLQQFHENLYGALSKL